jgi:hypothetical protein
VNTSIIGRPKRKRGITVGTAIALIAREFRWKVNSEVLQKAEQVTAPTARDSCRSHRVFEYQVPPDDPGNEFSEGGVAVCIGRSGHRDHRRELWIAQAGKGACDGGEDESQRGNGRPGMMSESGSSKNKDAGSDDRPDTKGNEAGRPRARRRLCSPLSCASARIVFSDFVAKRPAIVLLNC